MSVDVFVAGRSEAGECLCYLLNVEIGLALAALIALGNLSSGGIPGSTVPGDKDGIPGCSPRLQHL